MKRDLDGRHLRLRRLTPLLAVVVVLVGLGGSAGATASTLASGPVAANVAKSKLKSKHLKGHWVIKFAGSGEGQFSYSWPHWTDSEGNSCMESKSYSLNYSYRWSWTDTANRLGAGETNTNWTGGGTAGSSTTYGAPCPESVVPPSGSCSGSLRAPNGEDLGLWPQLLLNSRGNKVSVGFSTGGLVLVDSAFSSNCGNAGPDEYDGNVDGFVETGSILAKASFPLARAESGKTLTMPIAASHSESCSSASACSPAAGETGNDSQQAALTPEEACVPTQKWAGTPSEPLGPVVTCAAQDHYSGTLTLRFVKSRRR
ncbi:MAG TPA: hypothetical protein VMH33_01575 [Solirubrobacterales bacterium]|nr:hypothetical protein [Solirubrobacterales bacterium]